MFPFDKPNHLFIMLVLAVLSSLFATALATSRTSAPSGCTTVGSTETYTTISKAIAALSTTSTTSQCLFIQAGTYSEQVYIPARAAELTIYGYTTDTSTYYSNVVTITNSLSLLSASNDDATATVRNWAANTKVYNINIKNIYGIGSQALALSAYANNQGYYGVGLYGYQDTLLSEVGNQVYAKCYIAGAVDFIFGQHATTWIDSSDIRIVGPGAITANGRSSSSDVSFYVINRSSVAAASTTTATTGTTYLGRPWSEYARVVFQNTDLSSLVNSAGWEVWSTSEANTEHVTFEEYGNDGDGASGTRASFSSKLSSAIAITTILGSDYANWVDTAYLA